MKCVYFVNKFVKKTRSDGSEYWFPFLNDQEDAISGFGSVQEFYTVDNPPADYSVLKALLIVEAEPDIHAAIHKASEGIYFLADVDDMDKLSKNPLSSKEVASVDSAMAVTKLDFKCPEGCTAQEIVRAINKEINPVDELPIY